MSVSRFSRRVLFIIGFGVAVPALILSKLSAPERLGAATGEDDLAGPGPERCSDRLTALLDNAAGLAGKVSEADFQAALTAGLATSLAAGLTTGLATSLGATSSQSREESGNPCSNRTVGACGRPASR